MKLYNTLTRTVEEFTPHEAGKVKMYTCGPTVYNFAHIGNLRTYLMEDVLEKTFRYIGYDVKRIMNITDIGHLSSDADTGEDKMLLGARREHKTVLELAQYYTDAFFADCAALNIKKPDVVQPATGCVEDFIEVIASLMERGFAYKAGGNIYFDTSKVKQYHKFFNFKEDDLEVGVREGVDEPGAQMGQSVGRRLPRLAHRMFVHRDEIPRRIRRYPLRRYRQRLPAPHQRNRAERGVSGA